ncbi:hypothetical protein EVA_07036 [gut metagenome]|uniref:Uncharacterized protein n=1 Tax=gut metagenome TaxID=749906 RepID=J9GW78_9ZZZZ
MKKSAKAGEKGGGKRVMSFIYLIFAVYIRKTKGKRCIR